MTPHSPTSRPLDSGWQFRELDPASGLSAALADPSGWRAARVPGTVMLDLLEQGALPDPHVACQEQQVQWVGERDWCYRLDFSLDHAPAEPHVDLLAEGLDTFARVWLNGTLVLDSDNMFVPHRVPVKPLLVPGGNRLVIVFDSAWRRGREREAVFGRRHLWNGDSSRLHVRKAQYHYGWDWGPVVLTAGPWKPLRLHGWHARIDELDARVHVDAAQGTARVEVVTQLAGRAAGVHVHHALSDPEGRLVAEASVPSGDHLPVTLQVPAPRLWWPAGHGAQPLYTLQVQLRDAHGETLDRVTQRLGLRTVSLRQEPVAGEAGTSFHFEVNGRALFMGGANWIPDDTLLNRITPARYRERVRQAVDAHMPMLRVWGGGIYEDDAFYDACDELGVLVWQDFLFACGMYPAHADFQASVQREAEAAVRRLRHHPSLALWCGNNEDYAIAESIGQHGPGKDTARFEGRALYEMLLPAVCARLDPQRPYWPGSPYSPGAAGAVVSSDPTVGDRHSWEVWHGQMLPYASYHQVQARFVSEFGMQSHASLAVLEAAVPHSERFAESRTLQWHNKAGSGTPDGHRRLAVYMADTLRARPDLAGQVYATQFVQAEAMRYAYQDFRRRWQRAGARAVGGALVWQLNDCWPATSWAVIDSAGLPKPAWHAIRRALQPVSVAVRAQPGGIAAWVMSDRPDARVLTLNLAVHALDGRLLHEEPRSVTVLADGTTELHMAWPGQLAPAAQPLIVQASLHDGDALVASDVAWPEPFRFQRLASVGLSVERDVQAGCLWLTVQRPAKGVWLQADGVRFGNNFIDLLPGQRVRVDVQGLAANAPVQVQALDQDDRVV